MADDTAIKKRETETVQAAERTRDRWAYVPNVDIIERSEELLVLADMPGVKADSIDIQYENGLLTIHGRVEPRQDERGRLRFEKLTAWMGYRVFYDPTLQWLFFVAVIGVLGLSHYFWVRLSLKVWTGEGLEDEDEPLVDAPRGHS